ncbi:MAG TPA: hypothetical protein PKH10_08455 [bacterium]|nr:hypothetical protein [bacterium]
MDDKQLEFLRSVFLSNAQQGAFQRAHVYREGIDTKEFTKRRDDFIKDLHAKLRMLEEPYRMVVDGEEHCRNIQRIAEELSSKHAEILTDGRLRIGIAQKAVNLYLKYLWCADWITPPPPHCPIDGIILDMAGIHDVRWTTDIVTIEDYQNVIKRIREKIGDKPLADWELGAYNSNP